MNREVDQVVAYPHLPGLPTDTLQVLSRWQVVAYPHLRPGRRSDGQAKWIWTDPPDYLTPSNARYRALHAPDALNPTQPLNTAPGTLRMPSCSSNTLVQDCADF